MNMESVVFTPASLIDLLSKVDELKDYDIGISETIDGQIQLNIGSSLYIIDTNNSTDISVDDQVVESVEDTNLEAYENLDESVDVVVPGEGDEPVESGIIKELAKTLLVGGLVRLTAGAAKKLL